MIVRAALCPDKDGARLPVAACRSSQQASRKRRWGSMPAAIWHRICCMLYGTWHGSLLAVSRLPGPSQARIAMGGGHRIARGRTTGEP